MTQIKNLQELFEALSNGMRIFNDNHENKDAWLRLSDDKNHIIVVWDKGHKQQVYDKDLVQQFNSMVTGNWYYKF